jgi:hypothetical protein
LELQPVDLLLHASISHQLGLFRERERERERESVSERVREAELYTMHKNLRLQIFRFYGN